MKRSIIPSTVLFVLLSGSAMADCSPSTRIQNTGSNPNVLANVLSGKTVCAVLGTEKWQEYHTPATGVLVDYKKGPSDKVDPSKTVGSWGTSGVGGSTRVTYNYGSGGTYSYSVHSNGGTSYTFCGTRTIDGTLVSGQVSCGF